MRKQIKNEIIGQKILNRFGSYGFIGGLALGILVGVVIGGPNFYSWPAKTSILVILGCAVVGGLIGYLAPGYGVGSAAGGGASDVYYSDNGHGSSGGSGGSGSDGGSGGGDG